MSTCSHPLDPYLVRELIDCPTKKIDNVTDYQWPMNRTVLNTQHASEMIISYHNSYTIDAVNAVVYID